MRVALAISLQLFAQSECWQQRDTASRAWYNTRPAVDPATHYTPSDGEMLPMMSYPRSACCVLASSLALLCAMTMTVTAEDPWVVYEGGEGAGAG